MIWKHSRKLQGNEKGGLTAPTANPRKMGKPTHGIRRVYHLPSQTATILIKKEREDMYKITIQYHAPDNVKLSKLLMAAILKVIEQNSVNRVCVTQENGQHGNRKIFSYAGGGTND